MSIESAAFVATTCRKEIVETAVDKILVCEREPRREREEESFSSQ